MHPNRLPLRLARALASMSASVLVLGLSLLTPGCAGSCPGVATGPASVTPTPCGPGGGGSSGPATDPLTLLGGEGLVFARVDLAAIRQSIFGDAAQRLLELAVRSELPPARADGMLEALARTQAFAFAIGDRGFTLVAQGHYTSADLELFEFDQRDSRRHHVIHRRRDNAIAVANGTYAVIAERYGVEGVLDRIDGLEDPAPQGPLLRHVAESIGAYRSYFSVFAVPHDELRRELLREEALREVHADIRWGGLSVVQGGAGLEVLGRAHTITEAAAAVIVDMALAVQREVADELRGELPVLSGAARAVTLAREGTDGTLVFRPSEAETRAGMAELTAALEVQAARRASYED